MSRVAAIDGDALRRSLDDTDFSGIVHVVGDDDEAPVTITRGLSDRAAEATRRIDALLSGARH